jgi:SAM-dependent methyltransferase
MPSKVQYAWSRLRYILPHALRRGVTFGFCPICERRTLFIKEGPWLRDHFRCARCFSIPRRRAIISVLETFFPDWRKLSIHESSPARESSRAGATSAKIKRECPQCIQTHWYPDVPEGQVKDGYRCENLEHQTFPDASFDLVITQDVFEHVLDPARGFAEVARTLKPGGAHIFTIPWYYWKPTLVRAVRDPNGSIRHLVTPNYHGNPINSNGSLVVTEWGSDFCDFIYHCSGLTTTVIHIHDKRQGIEAKFIEVFVSRKKEVGSLV